MHLGDDLCSASLEEVMDRYKFTFELFPLSYVNAVDEPISCADEVFRKSDIVAVLIFIKFLVALMTVVP